MKNILNTKTADFQGYVLYYLEVTKQYRLINFFLKIRLKLLKKNCVRLIPIQGPLIDFDWTYLQPYLKTT